MDRNPGPDPAGAAVAPAIRPLCTPGSPDREPPGPDACDADGSLGRPPGLPGIFWSFLLLGLTGFGGVLPVARHMLVTRRGWLSEVEFAELLGLCQLLPGGNIINMSVAVGLRFRGASGALAGLLGLVAAPSAIVIAMGIVYDRYHADANVRNMLAGLAAAATGLLVSSAVALAVRLRGNASAITIASLCFVAIAVARFPLIPTIVVLAPASLLVAARRPR